MTAAKQKPGLQWLPGRYAVCRLERHEVIPPWAVNASGFVSVTRTEDELSVIVPEAAPPGHVQAERGWAALRVAGKIAFSEIGILSSLTGALSEAGVPVIAVSTYDTDYLLVKADYAEQAQQALSAAATFKTG